MTKKSVIVALILMLCITLSSVTVFAGKEEWIDETYDFSKIKRILVMPPNISNHLNNGIKNKEIEKVYFSKIDLPKHIEIITFDELIGKIKESTGIDFPLLYSQDEKSAIEFLYSQARIYADINIVARVFEYNIGTEYQEGYVYNTQEYETSYISGRRGTATIQSPVTKSHYVSGKNIEVAYAAVRFDVEDTNTKVIIFSRVDDRAHNRHKLFDHTKPKDILGRIVDSFYDTLSKQIEKKK